MKKNKIIIIVLILCVGIFFLKPKLFEANSGIIYAKTEANESDISLLYNVTTQQKVKDHIDLLKSKNIYTESNPLLIYNPYGTNTLSMYMYFETKVKAKLSYTIHVDDESITDFTQVLDSDYTLTHESQLIGLIPEMENTIIIQLSYEDGSTEEYRHFYSMGSLKGDEEVQLNKSKGISTQAVSDGLYVILGNDSSDQDFMYYYDNNGTIRGEVPIEEYRSHRLIFKEDKMYFSYNKTKMAEMNNIGQITNTYDLGKYELHHDYVFDEEGNILILATDTTAKTEEDIIVKLDLESGKVTQLIDLKNLLKTYKDTTNKVDDTWDWVHLNTIQFMDNDQIIVSSRETSTIIKISNISENPVIDFMIGEETFWKGSEYENLLLTKNGDFASQTGQHTVTYVEDETLPQAQYYLYMFNNNYGYSATNKNYDWSQIEGSVTGKANKSSVSKYYKYLVDENTRSYTLVDSFDVPYSSYVSSAQNLDSTTIINSGMAKEFQEYDSSHELIQSFEMEADTFIYRVYKYSFDNYYFNK